MFLKTSVVMFIVIASLSCRPQSPSSELQEDPLMSMPEPAGAQVSDAEADNLSIAELNYEIMNSAANLGVAELRAVNHIRQCLAESGIDDAVSMVSNSISGLVVDGMGADLCVVRDGLTTCGKEAVRLAATMAPFGSWVLKSQGIKDSSQVIEEGAKVVWNQAKGVGTFMSEHGQDLARYAFKLNGDIGFRNSESMKVLTIIAATGTLLLDHVSEQSCDVVRTDLARLYGMLSYEVTLTVGLSLITAEVGGAGGAAKLGLLAAKLNKIAAQNQRLAPMINTMTSNFRKLSKAIIGKKSKGPESDRIENGVNSTRAADAAGDAVECVINSFHLFQSKKCALVEEILKGKPPVRKEDGYTWVRFNEERQSYLEKSEMEMLKKIRSAMGKGVVSPEASQGVIRANDVPGFTHKLKILGTFGDWRFYGKIEQGVLILDKPLTH
jgi:hypothetical protein